MRGKIFKSHGAFIIIFFFFIVLSQLRFLCFNDSGNPAGQSQAFIFEKENTKKVLNPKWMKQVIGKFVEYAKKDKALNKYARGQDVTLYYTLRDMGLEFYMRLKGTVTGELTASDKPAEVHLTMDAIVFDKIFAQEINAGYAAITGDMSFEGDALKALKLEVLGDDLFRLYDMAVQSVGLSEKFVYVSPKTEKSSK
jgi:putative sterol carrier protein